MDSQTDWWRTFFTGSWLDVQRETWTEEETRAEVDFIQSQLRVAPPACLIDVPCGNGRHAIEIAARGYAVTAVDFTLPLLEDARRKAGERGVDVTCELQDMRDLSWKEAFDGAFCFWGSLGYFDDEDNAAFLDGVCRALRPGARFLLDTHVVETLLPRFEERAWRHAGETLVLEERTYDHGRSRVNVEWTFVKGGGVQKAASSIRIYTYRELVELMGKVGWRALEAYGSLGLEPFHLGAARLLLVAGKGSRSD